MEWTYLTAFWRDKGVIYSPKIYSPKLTCMNLTNSWCVEKIEFLVKALPEVHFYIAAHTFMANELKVLSRLQNVTLYPNSFPMLIEKILKKSDIYLDLNHDDKLIYIYDLVKKYSKPMMAFDNTLYHHLGEEIYEGIYSHERPEEMVSAIKGFMEKKLCKNQSF